jgi:hypothetical protein
MKLFSICVLTAVALSCFSGCASDDSDRGYGAYQQRAQHASYDPTPHTYGTGY